MKQPISVPPVLYDLAPSLLSSLNLPSLCFSTLWNRVVRPVPVLVHCRARPSPKKAVSCRPARVKISCPRQTSLSDDIDKLISWYSIIVAELGWEKFVEQRRGRGDFSILEAIPHAYCHFLRQYEHLGTPMVLAVKLWTEGDRQAALK